MYTCIKVKTFNIMLTLRTVILYIPVIILLEIYKQKFDITSRGPGFIDINVVLGANEEGCNALWTINPLFFFVKNNLFVYFSCRTWF